MQSNNQFLCHYTILQRILMSAFEKVTLKSLWYILLWCCSLDACLDGWMFLGCATPCWTSCAQIFWPNSITSHPNSISLGIIQWNCFSTSSPTSMLSILCTCQRISVMHSSVSLRNTQGKSHETQATNSLDSRVIYTCCACEIYGVSIRFTGDSSSRIHVGSARVID